MRAKLKISRRVGRSGLASYNDMYEREEHSVHSSSASQNLMTCISNNLLREDPAQGTNPHNEMIRNFFDVDQSCFFLLLSDVIESICK